MSMQVSNNSAHQSMGSGTASVPIGKQDFLESFTVLPEARFRTTPSGLKIAILEEGNGDRLIKGMKLKANYTGWLETGKKFDSSVGKEKPFEFVLGSGQVIKGWEEGLAGMKPGERRQLVIPANLAYGERGKGNIPPGSTLIFNVEAVAVEAANQNPNGSISITA